ncbi:MAG: hypothetical protein M1828_006675 [Chrysothrix sp. TS-e1954]|nr:MAG: hypothetical protein M1828_006675 [Chrysothrix sp. TS-e1954]
MAGFVKSPIDRTRWRSGKYLHSGQPGTPDEVSIFFVECLPTTNPRGVVLLVHGFPGTSYQWRYIITPLSDAGYRVIAPDFRGAGLSSKPRGGEGYRKTVLAEDLHGLITKHLGIKQLIHLVGHDIGGQIAHAYASRYPNDTKSVMWGEVTLPGTAVYERTRFDPGFFHFAFHWQIDLPEALVSGKETMFVESLFRRTNASGSLQVFVCGSYLKHFFDRESTSQLQ